MILLNTTFAIDPHLASEVIRHIRTDFIAGAEKAGMGRFLLTRMRNDSAAPDDALCVALQMRAPSEETAREFIASHRPALYAEMQKRWGMGVATFDSVLDTLYER